VWRALPLIELQTSQTFGWPEADSLGCDNHTWCHTLELTTLGGKLGQINFDQQAGFTMPGSLVYMKAGKHVQECPTSEGDDWAKSPLVKQNLGTGSGHLKRGLLYLKRGLEFSA